MTEANTSTYLRQGYGARTEFRERELGGHFEKQLKLRFIASCETVCGLSSIDVVVGRIGVRDAIRERVPQLVMPHLVATNFVPVAARTSAPSERLYGFSNPIVPRSRLWRLFSLGDDDAVQLPLHPGLFQKPSIFAIKTVQRSAVVNLPCASAISLVSRKQATMECTSYAWSFHALGSAMTSAIRAREMPQCKVGLHD